MVIISIISIINDEYKCEFCSMNFCVVNSYEYSIFICCLIYSVSFLNLF
jgi:hypothetical protein